MLPSRERMVLTSGCVYCYIRGNLSVTPLGLRVFSLVIGGFLRLLGGLFGFRLQIPVFHGQGHFTGGLVVCQANIYFFTIYPALY